jgi:hypothetical protein
MEITYQDLVLVVFASNIAGHLLCLVIDILCNKYEEYKAKKESKQED